MAQLIADRKDIEFVLYEQLGVENLCKADRYSEFNRKIFDMVIAEARNFAIKEVVPTNREGDRQGAVFNAGRVNLPECFHRIYHIYKQGEWIAMREDPSLGGQGFPETIYQAAAEYIMGANFSFSLYGFATHGAAKMIEVFGSPDQKALFLKKMYSGEWGGTMVLTEPQAGSDLGALTTTAKKNPDGTYSISGNKIFITNGENDLMDNIIHPVLARVEGAPAGTRGISIFIVPKIWVNEDGSPGEPNDVVCTGIEEKMGLHGSATCSMTFGGKGTCRGFLLGEENQGLKIMFHMMNEARLAVGFQGFVLASAAYLYALDYARERVQGKDLLEAKSPDAPPVPIIAHPDIRRMLMWMKAHVEGMRSFVYYVAHCFDKVAVIEDEEEKERLKGFIELFTPLVKAYCSDRGFEVCTQAVQTYGGYGYTQEYPVEQYLRDCKIASIYEGTNGIQAMDLLGRKLGMRKGAVFMDFVNEIQRTVDQAKAVPGLENLAAKLEKTAGALGETAMHLGRIAMSPDLKTAFAFASPFLEVMGDVIMAWMLLWRAALAKPKLDAMLDGKEGDARKTLVEKNSTAAFYDGQIRTASYFINAILPVTRGKMEAIRESDATIAEMHEVSFGGK